MKSYKDYTDDINRMRTKTIFSNGFREQLIEDSWKKLDGEDKVVKGDLYGTADGMIKIISNKEGKQFWGRIEEPSHNEIKVGDVISYNWDELFVGDGDIDSLRDDILGTIKHKKVDKINTRPVVEKFSSLFQDGEISSTKELLKWAGLIVGELIKRHKKEKV